MDGRWNEDTVQPFVTLLASGVPSPLERLLCWSGTGEGGGRGEGEDNTLLCSRDYDNTVEV